MNMKCELQITYHDYKAAQRLHMTPRRRFTILLYPLLAFLFLGFICAFKRFHAGYGARDFFISVVVIAYLILFIGVLLPYRWRKNYKQQKLLHKPVQCEFTADHFCSFSEHGNATLPWKEFHKWRESKALFLIYQSDNLFHAIPKRIFQNPEDQAQFRGYLMNNIGNPVI